VDRSCSEAAVKGKQSEPRLRACPSTAAGAKGRVALVGVSVLPPLLLLGEFLVCKILADVFGFPLQCRMRADSIHDIGVFGE